VSHSEQKEFSPIQNPESSTDNFFLLEIKPTPSICGDVLINLKHNGKNTDGQPSIKFVGLLTENLMARFSFNTAFTKEK